MIKMNNLKAGAVKNSPTLFIIAGVGLMVGSVIRACHDTRRYIDEIEEARRVKHEEQPDSEELPELNRNQRIKIAVKCYWETAALTSLSAMCFITSNRISLKRNAALAAMYGISEAHRLEYMAQTKNIVGEKKEQEIRERIAENTINRDRVTKEMLEKMPVGDTLCYDNMFGRYFFSSSEKIMGAEKRLNDRLFNEMYISLNDLYAELNMPKVGFGDEFGWNVNDGLINISRIYTENAEGAACIVVDYDVVPKHDYSKLY